MLEAVEDPASLAASGGKKRRLYFSLFDVHHHIGEDTDGKKNLTVNGSYDFFRMCWKSLQERYQKPQELLDCQKPRFIVEKVVPPAPFSFLERDNTLTNSWLFDQFVAFPFHDTYRGATGENGKIIQYHNSNNRIAKMTGLGISSGRLIGFCRLDPHDEGYAVEELKRCKDMGLRGLKLHPLSDDWASEDFFRNSPWLREILKKAIAYRMPIIFDCRYESTLRLIYDIVDSIRHECLESQFSEAYIDANFKVIIAHIGFLWQSGDLLATALSHPNLYGDLTGQFSDKIKSLCEHLKSKVKSPYPSPYEAERNLYWTKKVIIGSDYCYFEPFHIVDQVLYFLSEEFYKLVNGNEGAIHDIFSLNANRLFRSDIPIQARKGQQQQQIPSSECVMLEKRHYATFMQAFIEKIKETTSEASPYHARIIPHRTDKDSRDPLSKQVDFYFLWRNANVALAGVIPDQLDRIVLYFLREADRDRASFEALLHQVKKCRAASETSLPGVVDTLVRWIGEKQQEGKAS
jgi:predicted TIM-barrel fold metal-dependent hydrolase